MSTVPGWSGDPGPPHPPTCGDGAHPRARRAVDVRPVQHRYGVPGVPADGGRARGGQHGHAAGGQRLPAGLRDHEPGARPAVGRRGPSPGHGRGHRRLRAGVRRVRPVHQPPRPAGLPRPAGVLGRSGPDREPGGGPGPVRRARGPAADEPRGDDLRRRPGDRPDHRRRAARPRPVAAGLLVPRRLRPAHGRRGAAGAP